MTTNTGIQIFEINKNINYVFTGSHHSYINNNMPDMFFAYNPYYYNSSSKN